MVYKEGTNLPTLSHRAIIMKCQKHGQQANVMNIPIGWMMGSNFQQYRYVSHVYYEIVYYEQTLQAEADLGLGYVGRADYWGELMIRVPEDL